MKEVQKAQRDKRIVGHVIGEDPGPTLVIFGGIHGNEPAGVLALENVFSALYAAGLTPKKGRVIGVRGNLRALEAGKRYLKFDLNRIWEDRRISRAMQQETPRGEERDLLEIYQLLQGVISKGSPPFYFIDLHTTSSESPPFITINDAMINRKFSAAFPCPIILGIEEYLSGPLLSYMNQRGYVSLGFEAGMHTSPDAVRHCESFIYCSLVHSGLFSKREMNYERHHQNLALASLGKARFYEVIYRHKLEKSSDFKMEAGFESFQELKPGTVLAEEYDQWLEMTKKAILFMPLYQRQGEEGFFLIRKIPFWAIKLSAWMRRLKIPQLLPLLPGVRWLNTKKRELVINLNVARFFTKPFFHLMGYRFQRQIKKQRVLSYREYVAKNSEYQNTPWY